LHQAGDLAAAAKVYRKVLAADARQPDAARLLGEVLIDQGQAAEAAVLLRRFVARDGGRDGGQFGVLYTLGNACRMSGAADEAVGHYRAAIGLNAGFAGVHHGMGLALRAAGQERAAADAFAAAVRADGGFALGWHELGMTLAMLGELGPAAVALQRALAINPNMADTRRHLLAIQAEAVQGGVAAGEVAQLEAVLRNPGAPVEAAVEAGFALGKVYDKAGRYDEAFAQFARANQLLRGMLARAGQGFDAAKLVRDVDRLIEIFTPQQFAQMVGWGDSAETPVFIVGMPRSGTSLVEQIIASHAQAFGAGEIKDIGAAAGKLGWRPNPAWNAAGLQAAGAEYLAALRRGAGDALRVSDKMPDNMFQLGLIAAMLPGARVIFCERDALDTCFSCYTQRFSEPHGFDTDLADCGRRYREVARLARHWQTVLPLRMLSVSYERLVADVEGESRKLIAFLGLEWDPACLEFHKTERVVKTASWAQVRQAAYQSSVGRARHYERHLGPLVAALGDEA
jgi:tetratricopeptide (TPR) repeat protein